MAITMLSSDGSLLVEAGGDSYLFDGEGMWKRVSQDGSITGDATNRELRLLDEIMRLQSEIGERANGD